MFMKYILPFAACVIVQPAMATDCSAPAYGDDPSQVEQFVAMAENPPGPVFHNMPEFLHLICEGKFNGKDRDALKALGLTDRDIERHSVVQIGAHVIAGIIHEMMTTPSDSGHERHDDEPPKMDRT